MVFCLPKYLTRSHYLLFLEFAEFLESITLFFISNSEKLWPPLQIFVFPSLCLLFFWVSNYMYIRTSDKCPHGRETVSFLHSLPTLCTSGWILCFNLPSSSLILSPSLFNLPLKPIQWAFSFLLVPFHTSHFPADLSHMFIHYAWIFL